MIINKIHIFRNVILIFCSLWVITKANPFSPPTSCRI